MKDINLKKTFLQMLIGSVGVSALLGIWAILSGEFGELQARILMTTLTVVATSILGLACGAFWESEKSKNSILRIVPVLGMIMTGIAALLVFSLIWKLSSSNNNVVLKTIAVSGIFAFSLSQLSLLSFANLSQKFQWALTAVYFTALSLAAIGSVLIIIEPQSDNDYIERFLGVLAIIDAALTVMIPIFHRLSRGDFAEKRTEIQKVNDEISKLKDELSRLEQRREELLQKNQ